MMLRCRFFGHKWNVSILGYRKCGRCDVVEEIELPPIKMLLPKAPCQIRGFDYE